MSFRIEFAETAATQFYLVPHETYARMRQALVAHALELAEQPERGLGRRRPQVTVVGGFEVRFEIHFARMQILIGSLLKLRSESAPAELTLPTRR